MINASLSLWADFLFPTTARCRNCGRGCSDLFELSRLVHDEDDLLETPVVALLHLCPGCLEALSA